jgi:hypothetical protein
VREYVQNMLEDAMALVTGDIEGITSRSSHTNALLYKMAELVGVDFEGPFQEFISEFVQGE